MKMWELRRSDGIGPEQCKNRSGGSNRRLIVNVKMGENCRKVTGGCRGGCVELSVFEVGRSEQ